MSRIYGLLSEYKSHIELSQKVREVQSCSAWMNWNQRKAEFFDVCVMERSCRSIPYALFLPNDERIDMVVELERAEARELARVMGPAGERLGTCQRLLGKVTEAVDQLDE
ncbi:hypothetical protein FRC10_012077 [Ceratobasidium sp. 414]|nr:hypothetical protein FRC10_012077 [Ceratobasidium sp. 414]